MTTTSEPTDPKTPDPKTPDPNIPDPNTSDARTVEIAPLDVPSQGAGAGRAIRGATVDAVRVALAVEIGRVSMSIKDLRGTRQGTVIPLDRGIGEPIDIRVNEVLIARGEIVATEGHKYGIRVTEILGNEEGDDPA